MAWNVPAWVYGFVILDGNAGGSYALAPFMGMCEGFTQLSMVEINSHI